MKKTLLFLITFVMSIMNFGQVFYENFDQPYFPPPGWELKNTGDLNWELQSMDGAGFRGNIVDQSFY
jgi:hypothetical protein